MKAQALTISGLQVHSRGTRILHGIDLPAIAPGTLVGLVGPNGAGKSTLLRSLAGLLPTTGSLYLGALDLLRCSRRERAQQLAFMPQQLPDGIAMSVLETLLGALHAGRATHIPDAVKRAHGVLEHLGIVHLAMRPLDQLSGGQRQLVSLAQAMIREPSLLLLDEPTSALDLHHQNRVMGTLRGLADQGRIVIVVLHDLPLAARWADRLVVLANGRALASGSPQQTLTPALLAEVYKVEARVETCSRGHLQIAVDASL
ncbi:ABC transporter ATP-binding protein [Pseudomonas fulva]|uniref:ABC transporter ATP-binding protein n=1 Tax=Pseudomonas fulva TaxID=47880 RepID=UPI00201E076A|nr:ABC transporter ATP-binding protein [Pseudomonas fulva]UQY36150.1 ABC transporter ATP-binding protein [Pseudomonas fulva]